MATKKSAITEGKVKATIKKPTAQPKPKAPPAPKVKKTKASDKPTVVVGSHLTVITYPNGKTELVWDDEALARDVAEAIASVQQKPAVKAKTARLKKTK